MHASTLLSVSWLLVASNALAADQEAREREAKKACLNGDAATGVAILTDLYVDTNDPTYIFNQGRCYEQSNLYPEAISRFREYLRKVGGKNKADAAAARKHIADCRALLAEKKTGAVGAADVPKAAVAQAVRPQAAPEQPPVAQAPLPSFPPTAAEPPASLATGPAAPAVRPGAGLRTAGVVTAAVGGAALVAGVVLNLKSNSMVGELTPRYDKGTDSSRQTYKTLSMVGYGVGAAGLVGGAILYTLGWRAGAQAQVALLPALIDDGAGALLTGAF